MSTSTKRVSPIPRARPTGSPLNTTIRATHPPFIAWELKQPLHSPPPAAPIPFNGAVRGVTSTQALASFTVSNPAACSIIIYTDAARTIPAHDSDASLFPGATACNRAGNIVSGHNVNAVLGSRTVQMGADSIAYSRALAQQTQYWGLITDLTNSQTLSFEFTTLPIPFGQTWNDMPPALAPAISNTDATQVIVDPQTGAPLHRMSLLNDVAITPVWGAKADANISCSPRSVQPVPRAWASTASLIRFSTG